MHRVIVSLWFWMGTLCIVVAIAATRPARAPVDPGRDVSAEEATEMVRLILLIADESANYGIRLEATKELESKHAHVATADALMAVIRREHEGVIFRSNVLWTLCLCPDKANIERLIGLLVDVPGMRPSADQMLVRLTRARPHAITVRREMSQEDIDAVVKAWRGWWREHGRSFVYDASVFSYH